MNDKKYWIISAGKHELGYPIGRTLFLGTEEQAEKHAELSGNYDAIIMEAHKHMPKHFMNAFLAIVEESCV